MNLTEAAPLEFETFKLGKEGWPVIVCQLALNSHYPAPGPLALDGVFGPETARIAKAVQEACHVLADGIVGPAAQEAFVKAKCAHAQRAMTPAGLLAGLCNIESSYQWACVSPENEDGSHDYGCTQENGDNPNEQWLRGIFNPDTATHVLAGEARGFYNAFRGKVGERRAWELAALAHNWPAAAYAIAEGNEAWLNKPFPFTTAKGYPTGLAYVDHYISVATAQVTSWVVA